ncbi:MAG: ATP-grasp domain-containing protein, partial [Myxococcales bacterium]|nr:ATP-grasp domain-containing protein [Myxococcales bacterium]
HPGYGFLSENAAFSEKVEAAGIVFIGPLASAITAMGEKTRARRVMKDAGVPIVPGTVEAVQNPDEAVAIAEEIGFPVMIKAAAGGGGKGLRLIRAGEDVRAAVRRASSEAEKAFGDGSVYIEKYVNQPRHIEFQILADTHGNVLHLNERECSVQRRHQKIIEETPSPFLAPEVRSRMAEAAIAAARAVRYRGAGTIEFLVDAEQNFYFLEMNTRLQVEHPITEMVHRVDLVHEMIRIAQGEAISFSQADVQPRGSSIECRIYAEDPEHDFMPSPGLVSYLREPSGPNVRIDSGVEEGSEVSLFYDPMVAKLCVWGATREQAIARMQRALSEYRVGGITTNIPFLQALLAHPEFRAGNYDTTFIDRHWDELALQTSASDLRNAAIAAAVARHLRGRIAENLGGNRNDVRETNAWRLVGRFRRLHHLFRL